MHIIDPQAASYAEQYSSGEDDLLQDITRQTSTHPHAHMLSGQVQGKFLEMISLLMQPGRILEIGTFTGYSALCLARGLKEDGWLHTIEIRPEDAETAKQHFLRANLQDKIILHLGNALDIIPTLDEIWDLVFIDADKVGYAEYYRMVLPLVRPGGLIIADNVLFHGEVIGNAVRGKNALAIHRFNEMVRADESVDKILLTVRDGLLMIRKK